MNTAPPRTARTRFLRRADRAAGVVEAIVGWRRRDRPGIRVRSPRRTTASPMAMAKPTATGVNELRPPEAIAAHQAASTSRPDASPTPRVSPAGASDGEQADEAGHPDAEQQARPPNSNPWPIDSQTVPIGQRDRELSEHGRTIPSAVAIRRDPMVRGGAASGGSRACRPPAEVPAVAATSGR